MRCAFQHRGIDLWLQGIWEFLSPASRQLLLCEDGSLSPPTGFNLYSINHMTIKLCDPNPTCLGSQRVWQLGLLPVVQYSGELSVPRVSNSTRLGSLLVGLWKRLNSPILCSLRGTQTPSSLLEGILEPIMTAVNPTLI